jgi:aminoacrylate peracid reductase
MSARPADREAITAGPWPPRYTFSPAVRAGNLLFLSGTTAVDENMQLVGPGDIAAQTRYIFGKFERLLAAAGGSLADIVETTDYITTTENYSKTADVRRELFRGGPYPASTGVIVAGLLRPGALIEISAVALLPASSPSQGEGDVAVDPRPRPEHRARTGQGTDEVAGPVPSQGPDRRRGAG